MDETTYTLLPLGFAGNTILAVCGIAVGSVGVLLGQSSTPVVSGIGNEYLNALGGLSSLGFAVWYAWYVTAYALPARDKIHAETIQNILKESREEAREQRNLFEARTIHLNVQADMHLEAMNKLTIAVERMHSNRNSSTQTG